MKHLIPLITAITIPAAFAAETNRFPPPYPHLAKPARYLSPTHLALATADPFATVTNFYLTVPTHRGWHLVSPTESGLEAWRRANAGDKHGNQAIVIILTKPKSKIKCTIEIGRLRSASRSGPLTIISIRI